MSEPSKLTTSASHGSLSELNIDGILRERLPSNPENEAFKGLMKSAKYVSKVGITGSFTPRRFHTAVNYEDFMFVFAGCKGEVAMSDLACFHYATRSWSAIENESVQKLAANTRYGHSAALYGDSMFVYGGTSERFFIMEDLLEFKFETQAWTMINGEGAKPGPRYGHSAVVYDNSMYIFGGMGFDEKPMNDIYELNLDTLKWSKIEAIGTSPPSRLNHSAVVFKDSMFIFGGTNGVTTLGDFWEYKLKNKSWSLINVTPSPSAREGHTAVVIQNSMYIIGGSVPTMDIYEFDFDFRKWYKVQPVGENVTQRQFHSAVVRGDCIFLVGGPGDNSAQLDYLCIGKDDFEEEFELDEIAKMQNIPKSAWEASAMQKHPEIVELKERLRPLTQAPSYSRNLFTGKTEAKSALTYQTVLQLIMEHLDQEGHHRAIRKIEEESGVHYQKHTSQESRLMTLLRIGKRKIRKDMFNENFNANDLDEMDPEVPVVDHLPRRMDDKEEQDVNIWNEQIDSRRNIMKVKDESDNIIIRAATLNKLVQYLTAEKEKNNATESNFMRIFMYTYQSFTTPEMLLKKLIQRYHVPIPKGMEEDKFKAELQQPIRLRVCNVMKFWIDKCSWDFNDKMIAKMNAFIDGPLSRDGNLGLVKQLRNALTKTVRKRGTVEEEKYTFGVNPAEPKVPKNIFSTSLNISAIDEVEVARQLTLIEFGIFSQIMPTELLNRSWCTADLKHKAPHIIEMQNRRSQLTNYIITSILSDTQNKRNRAKAIERWVKIAENLRTLKNFQTLFAVLEALNSPLVTRLVQTFQELPPRTKEVMNDFQAIISKEGNYANYRELLKYSATPCIPFMDVLLSDVLQLEDQNPDLINNSLINFHKRHLLFRAITVVQGYQQIRYNLQPVHQIAKFLQTFPQKPEDELKELTYKCEQQTGK